MLVCRYLKYSANLETCLFAIEIKCHKTGFLVKRNFFEGNNFCSSKFNHNTIKKLMSGRFHMTNFQFKLTEGYLLLVNIENRYRLNRFFKSEC